MPRLCLIGLLVGHLTSLPESSGFSVGGTKNVQIPRNTISHNFPPPGRRATDSISYTIGTNVAPHTNYSYVSSSFSSGTTPTIQALGVSSELSPSNITKGYRYMQSHALFVAHQHLPIRLAKRPSPLAGDGFYSPSTKINRLQDRNKIMDYLTTLRFINTFSGKCPFQHRAYPFDGCNGSAVSNLKKVPTTTSKR